MAAPRTRPAPYPPAPGAPAAGAHRPPGLRRASAPPGPRPTARPARRGFVYTIALFFMVAVLVQLLSDASEHNRRRWEDLSSAQDGEALYRRLGELARASLDGAGLEAAMGRNATHLNLTLTDRLGFPLMNSTLGRSRLVPLKPYLERNWTAQANASLLYGLNPSNLTGIALSTAGGLNYRYDARSPVFDEVNITFPDALGPNNITLNLSCASALSPAPSLPVMSAPPVFGRGLNLTINFSSSSPSGALYDTDEFDVLFRDKEVVFYYPDTAGDLVNGINVTWHSVNRTLSMRSFVNTTYGGLDYPIPLNKTNMSCAWTLAILMNASNASADGLYLPLDVELNLSRATYSGPLWVWRT